MKHKKYSIVSVSIMYNLGEVNLGTYRLVQPSQLNSNHIAYSNAAHKLITNIFS